MIKVAASKEKCNKELSIFLNMSVHYITFLMVNSADSDETTQTDLGSQIVLLEF